LTINGANKTTTIIEGAGPSGPEGFRIRADVDFNNLTLTNFPRAIYISITESNHQVTVANSNLRDNTNTDNSYSGSAIVNYCTSCTISLSNVDVYDNASTYCGAITSNGALNISNNSRVHGNQATSTYGGAICNNDGALSLSQSLVYGNDTLGNDSSDLGGGIYQSGGSVSLFLSEVYGNSAHTGGGIYLDGGNLNLQNSQVYGNTAAGSGGGLYLSSDGSLTIDSSLIRENAATIGGGLYIWSDVKIQSSTIISNTASNYGGGVYVNLETTTLVNTTISGNQADTNGAGIYAYNSAIVRLANVTIANNTADADDDGDGRGGGVYQSSSSVILFKNSIIAGNHDLTVSPFEPYAPDCFGTLTSDGYNLVGLANALCTITGDQSGMLFKTFTPALDARLGPLTLYTVENYYHPVLFGPAVDQGNPSGCKDYANVTLGVDQLGQVRPAGSASPTYTPRCDLGAVESFFKRYALSLPLLLR
jgi:hypothetical protein